MHPTTCRRTTMHMYVLITNVHVHSLVLIYKNRHTFVHVQVRQIAVAMVMSTFILF